MFDLSSIKKTKRLRAPKLVIYGDGKVGKTTFAASAPNAIGILTEDGSSNVDAEAFPMCKSLSDVYTCIQTLLTGEHKFESVFLDSLDWLEPMMNAHVSAANNWANIESPGFGKGHVAAAEEWRTLLAGFDALRDEKNMAVVLIAHQKVKRFESPLHDGYDIYNLKLQDRASAIVQEWADVIGFCATQVLTKETDAGYGQKEMKAKTTGKRILHVEPHPAYAGGNRFGLKNMDLKWDVFMDNLQSAIN